MMRTEGALFDGIGVVSNFRRLTDAACLATFTFLFDSMLLACYTDDEPVSLQSSGMYRVQGQWYLKEGCGALRVDAMTPVT
jgi:hypothetical protein